MKLSKRIFLLSSLTVAGVLPLSVISCAGGDLDGNSFSIPSNKPGTTAPQIKVESFNIDDYFTNLSTKNPNNEMIDVWIKDFNTALKNDVSATASFNRTSETQPIDIAPYLQVSANRIRDEINAKFLNNSNNSFSQGLAYDIRVQKISNTKLKFKVSIYDPIKPKDNLLTKEFDLDFVFTPKEFHKLIEPIKQFKTDLMTLKDAGAIPQIKPFFDKLDTRIKEAEKLVADKSEDKSKVDEVIANLTTDLANLRNENQNFINSNKFAMLVIESTKQKAFITSLNKNAELEDVKPKVTQLNNKISEADAYILLNKPVDSKINQFILELGNLGKSINQTIDEVKVKFDELSNNLAAHVRLKDITDPSTTLPSVIKAENIQIDSAKNINGLLTTFTLSPYDYYGKVTVSATLKLGEFSSEISDLVLPIELMQNTAGKTFLLTTLQNEASRIITGTWPTATVTREVRAAAELLKNLTTLINEAETDDNREVLNDKVALLLWAFEFTKTKNKDTALTTIKTDFLNKDNSNDFSKLMYLQENNRMDLKENNRWLAIQRLIKIYSFANSGTTSTSPDLSAYKEDKFVKFINAWFKDYLEKYYNENSAVTNRQWVLFEYFQPLRTLEVFILLEKHLTEELKNKTLNTVAHFSRSLSNYGQVPNTGSNAGMRFIDNHTHASNAFIVNNYLDLHNKNLTKALSDASDYKKWLEGVNWVALTQRLTTTPVNLLSMINNIRLQNNLYNEFSGKKSDLKFSTVDFQPYISWFKDTYMPTNLTFEKVNDETGEPLMRIIAVFYLSLATNKKAQSEFLTQLKESELLKNRSATDFTNLNAITRGFAKNVWTGTFLK